MTLKLEDIDPKEDIRMTGAELIGYLVEARVDELKKPITTHFDIDETDWYMRGFYDAIEQTEKYKDNRIKKLKELTGGV